jgi:DNA mismatch repair ATPase MutS
LGNFDSEVDDLTWYDLDFFEIFKIINATSSSIGSEALYQRLRNYNFAENDAKRIEQLIYFFDKNPKNRERIQYLFARLGKKDNNFVENYLTESKSQKLPHLWLYTFCGILPIALLILLLILPSGLVISLLIASIGFNILYYFLKKTGLDIELDSMRYLVQSIAAANEIVKISTPFQEELEENLKKVSIIAKFGFSFRIRTGSEAEMIADYVNALFMLPFISYNIVISKLIQREQEVKKVWYLLGEMEPALAILNFRLIMPTTSLPVFTEKVEVHAKGVYHPLLSDPVPNDVDWVKNTLVTGSNASGKSTYVKAVAINSILSNTIHTALATEFSLPRTHVLSSMAIEDNLFEGDSYFVAEIKSIKRMLNLVRTETPCLCFVDEILKGTNTIERISASSSIVHWLNQFSTLAFIATHDIELTEILSNSCENIHFEEQVTKENGITFNYKLLQGPSTTRNAIQLLQVMDYPNQIVTEAKELAHSFDVTRRWKVLAKD